MIHRLVFYLVCGAYLALIAAFGAAYGSIFSWRLYSASEILWALGVALVLGDLAVSRFDDRATLAAGLELLKQLALVCLLVLGLFNDVTVYLVWAVVIFLAGRFYLLLWVREKKQPRKIAVNVLQIAAVALWMGYDNHHRVLRGADLGEKGVVAIEVVEADGHRTLVKRVTEKAAIDGYLGAIRRAEALYPRNNLFFPALVDRPVDYRRLNLLGRDPEARCEFARAAVVLGVGDDCHQLRVPGPADLKSTFLSRRLGEICAEALGQMECVRCAELLDESAVAGQEEAATKRQRWLLSRVMELSGGAGELQDGLSSRELRREIRRWKERSQVQRREWGIEVR